MVDFVDFKKAFDLVFREALCKILKSYGIPEKIVRLIRYLYYGFECAVLHEGSYSSFFLLEIGVKQSCLLLGSLFVVIIDWLMTETTRGRNIGWKGDFGGSGLRR